MTPELLKAVVLSRLDVCFDDINDLVGSVGDELHRIADGVKSGDNSEIEKAPERIQELVKKLQEGISKNKRDYCGEEESMVEVEFYNLAREVLSLPLAGPPEVQIEGGGKITTLRRVVLAALYEVMSNICESGATQVKLKLSPGKREMRVLAIGIGSKFSDTNLDLARRLINSAGGDIAMLGSHGIVLLIVPDLGLRTGTSSP